MIKIEQLSKTYGQGENQVVALEPLDQEISEGEFVSIIGPSGCGKSTLLRLIANLEEATSGRVILETAQLKRPVGFVFQDAVLLPWKTVAENIRFPLDTSGVSRKEANEKVQELVELVGLTGFEKSLPKQLSGGMRQKSSNRSRFSRQSSDPFNGRTFFCGRPSYTRNA